jgi:putative transposase
VIVSRKIKISPTYQQKKLFRQWIGTFRYIYNKTLSHIKQLDKVPNWMSISKTILSELPEWVKPIPYQIKKIAIKEACKNLSRQKLNCKKTHHPFKMHFKSKKNIIQSCYIPKSAILQKGIYPRVAGKIYYHEKLPDKIKDGRLVMINDRFYVSVPTTKNITHSENQGRVVAIDPGVRKFITFVSHNKCGYIGKYDIGRIFRLCSYLDKLVSKIALTKSKQKKIILRTAAGRIRVNIKNLVDELHNKTAKFLVDNFDVILLPTFETQNMVSKSKRKISSKSVRMMMTFAHYKFKQKLKHKAFECGKVVIDVNEAYTSKTNNFTGVINNKLGSAQFIKYNNKKIDRDLNGALGILLKALVDAPNLAGCLTTKFNPNCVVSKC